MSLMLDEIRQQPDVLDRLSRRPPDSLAHLGRRFARRRPEIAVIVARGTSDNAALFGRYLFEVALEIPTMLAAPSVANLYGRFALPRDALIIGISQSGESTDINGFMEAAKRHGALCVAITNHAGSPLAAMADEVLLTEAGVERSVAATKTYTAQMMALYWLAVALGAPITESDLRAVARASESAVELESGIAAVVEHHREIAQAAVIGRGVNYGNGLELALKLMETSYVVACGYAGADFAHGPIAMVGPGFPVFAFCPPGPTSGQTSALLDRVRQAGADTVAIGARGGLDGVKTRHTIEVEVPSADTPGLPSDILSPIPLVIPGQTFAARLAEAKGLDPDRPRSLTKVTRTL